MLVVWYKIILNKRSAKKYGWELHWFGANAFDAELVNKIKRFQEDNYLYGSGVCDRITYRRLLLKVLMDIKNNKTN